MLGVIEQCSLDFQKSMSHGSGKDLVRVGARIAGAKFGHQQSQLTKGDK